MGAKTDDKILTLTEAAVRLGCQAWHLTRLFRRGLLPEERVGRARVVRESRLPELQRVLRETGVLK